MGIFNGNDNDLSSLNLKGSHPSEYEEIEVIENYDLEWTRCESCDMIFKRSDNGWHGKLLSEDKCIVRGAKLIAEIHLTGDGLNSRDRGEDAEGNKIFGGDSLYKFKRGN